MNEDNSGAALIGIFMALAWSAYALYLAESARRKGRTKRRKLFGNQYRASGYQEVLRANSPKQFLFMMGLYYSIGFLGICTAVALLVSGKW